MVTNAALFQSPATQVKAPLMTFVPNRLPGASQVLVPVTVPFNVKLPKDRTVNPN
jgi:hypothetical protein